MRDFFQAVFTLFAALLLNSSILNIDCVAVTQLQQLSCISRGTHGSTKYGLIQVLFF